MHHMLQIKPLLEEGLGGSSGVTGAMPVAGTLRVIARSASQSS
jgi:hypothetical protein